MTTCKDLIEDEMHVLLHCPLYNLLRADLFHEAEKTLNDFIDLNDTEKISFRLTNASIVNISAKTCYLNLNKRCSLLYSKCIYCKKQHKMILNVLCFFFFCCCCFLVNTS